MKTLNIYIISIAVASTLFFSHGIHTQSVVTVSSNGQIADCLENIPIIINKEKIVNTIIEEDYPYLKRLECLTNGYLSDIRDLDLKFRNINHKSNSHYVLTGTGTAIDVEATYDRNGKLMEATLIESNTQIPKSILHFIYSDDKFDGWTMTGNEKVVKNFDPYRTEYKVTLSNGNETRILYFREHGENIAFLDRR